MKIDVDNMSLAEQVMARQSEHAKAIGDHLEQYGRLTSGDLGLILQLLTPITDALVDGGTKLAEMSSGVFQTGAEKMGQSRQLYIDAERISDEAVSQVAARLGVAGGPSTPPAPPTLGAPGQAAPKHYGAAKGSLFEKAYRDGYGSVEWATGTAGQARDRVGDALSASRSVTETVDVRSFLPVPVAEDPEVEEIRWAAGAILGSIDWVWDKLFGFSLLEEVTKPFSGNWVRVNEAAMAWTHTGDATKAISQNTTGMLPGMASWTGTGSEAFLASTALVSQAHLTVSGPAGTVSTALKAVAFLSKKIASQLVKLLGKIADKLAKIAARAAVPVVGWAMAAWEAIDTTNTMISEFRSAYKRVNLIYALVRSMASNVTAIADNAFRMADLYEAMARGTAARVA